MSEKNKGGRPTKYKEEYCDQLIEFFDRPVTIKKKEQKLSNTGAVVEVENEVLNDPPTFYGFAAKLGVHMDSLTEWRNKYPKFSAAYKKAKALQANFIAVGAMTGKANTAFSIFMMKNNFKWTDRVEQKNETTISLPENFEFKKIEKD